MSTRGNDRRSRAAVARRHGLRALTAGAALTGTLLVIAGPAHAATNVGVTAVGALAINAGNLDDDITVSVDVDGSLLVTNPVDVVMPVAPCVAVTANQVDCPSAGVVGISASTGNGDDVLRNQTALRSRADMGAGDDRFKGGPARDTVFGNDGDDTLVGDGGNNDVADGGPNTDTCDAENEVNCEL
ncbi:hypothetical protein ITP53_11835 [Nonomuraea sp. K274]|uniref:Hemolysin type calcium-binding protein n=1 Tax=Nonomuraea cypriaca TaxID=1187855 RepID=A0A931EW77_9ACTN|nr:hypothetical protein [Nonomuraea cypriaca]MBF8186424.1 hypothetical protein [Nonomuraea cypriaca]